MNKRKSIISRMMMLSVRKTYPDCLPSFLSFLSSLPPSQQLSPSSLFTQSSSIEISLREIKAFPFVSYASLNNAPLTTTLVCLLNSETEIKSRILFRSFLTSSFFPLALIFLVETSQCRRHRRLTCTFVHSLLNSRPV